MVLPRGLTWANPFGRTVATRHTLAGKAVVVCSWRTFGMVAMDAPYDAQWDRRTLFVSWLPFSQRASSECASARRKALICSTSSGSTVNSTLNPSGLVTYSDRQYP